MTRPKASMHVVVLAITLFCSPRLAVCQQNNSPALTGEPATANAREFPIAFIQTEQLIKIGGSDIGGIVIVRGAVSPAQASEAAQLILIPETLPPDKILDLVLVAPASGRATGEFKAVEERFEVKGPVGVIGVRVRSATNVLETSGAPVNAAGSVFKDFKKLLGKKASANSDGSVEVEDFEPKTIKAVGRAG